MASTITVTSPLGADAFILTELRGREELGALFHYEAQLVTTKPGVKLTDLVGQDMTITFDALEETARHVHGFVTKAVGTGKDGRLFTYQVTIEPWLALLTRTKNCRIFQNTTIPDILKKVLRERGVPELEESLSGTYSQHEYVVQYRESDFNFLSRLMEREGIYYFFKHAKGKHTLVLADGYGAHQPAPGWEKIPYYPPTAAARRERDHIDDWSFAHTMQSANFVLNDYDFKRPAADLNAKVFGGGEHEHDEYEVYDYPGEYYDNSPGDQYAGVRFDEARAQTKVSQGSGTVRGLNAGALFTLTDHPRDDQNKEYLVTHTTLQLVAGDYDSSGQGQGAQLLRCSFNAIEGNKQFRTPRTTPRPVVHGPQTAKVVGKAGKEIWTDEFGRVKVQFHWDRLGKSDENSSCWVRVSQVWAGAGWGAMHVPRIGQEVVVSFLEGDPDRPLITGRVYNGTNKPPFPLPSKDMKSGIKSDSTPGGGGNNEFSFDDTKGNELIFTHAQWNMTTNVDNDKVLNVTHDRTSTISNDDTEHVVGFQKVNVDKDQTITVKLNQITTVKATHTLDVTSTSLEKIGAAKTLQVGALGAAVYDVKVTGVMKEDVSSDKTMNVHGKQALTVDKDSTETVTGAKTTTVTKDDTLKAKNISATADQNISVNASKGSMTLSAKTNFKANGETGLIELTKELTIRVGKATITLKKDGTILINGKGITVDAGSKDLTQKGKNVNQNP